MAGEVELRELRIFLVLARELHFGRTAERLLLSQARVSQAVKSLEVDIGARLFERTSRRVALTPPGRELLERLEPAYDQLLLAVDGVRRSVSSGISGVLRLGLPNQSSGGPNLLRIVRRFREQNPACEVQFVTPGLREDPLRLLRGGEVDLVALRLPLQQPDLAVGPVLSRETRVLLVAEHDPLAERDAIDYDDVGDRRVSENPAFPAEMMDVFIPPVTSSGRVLNRIRNESIEQLMLRVALGEQVHPTVASWLDHHPHPGIVAVPIRDLPVSETALVRVRNVRGPRVTAFLEVVETVLAPADA
jgi:DNA-binding transcriptional LysR family regulator